MTGAEDEARRAEGHRVLEEVLASEVAADESPVDVAAATWLYADVWTRPGLTRKERRWITLTCVAISGGPIERHVYGALRSGDIAPDEMDEFALQLAAYAGFPVAAMLNRTIKRVRAELGDEATDRTVAIADSRRRHT